MSREHGALAACGTRRESVHGGSLAASMPPRVQQPARTPRQRVDRLLFLRSVLLGLRQQLRRLQLAC
ncbi:hypothetical protein FPL04_09490 [Xanthomonas arboricola]|nr:hypothetical protein FPL04_09490 [Xanthomonas arboricola]